MEEFTLVSPIDKEDLGDIEKEAHAKFKVKKWPKGHYPRLIIWGQ